MIKKGKNNLNNGSVAIYAIVTVFSFVIILSGMFASAVGIRKSQLKTLIKIKEVYAEQLDQADEIAEQLNQ